MFNNSNIPKRISPSQIFNKYNRPSFIISDPLFPKFPFHSGGMMRGTFLPTRFGSYVWTGIAWSPQLSIFVAVGSGRVAFSYDGINWIDNADIGAGTWKGICWSPELRLFCAVATAGGVITSSDGKLWNTKITLSGGHGWSGICWSPERREFCAISTFPSAATSKDGENWSISSTGLSGIYSDICWSPALKLYFAVHASGTTVSFSRDAVIWDFVANAWPTTPGTPKIAWSPKLNLFCMCSGTFGHSLRISSNGKNWISVTPPPTLNTGGFSQIKWLPYLGVFALVPKDVQGVASNLVQHLWTSENGYTWKLSVTSRDAISQVYAGVAEAPELGAVLVITTTQAVSVFK